MRFRCQTAILISFQPSTVLYAHCMAGDESVGASYTARQLLFAFYSGECLAWVQPCSL